jgi:hypothetical protein
MQGTAGEGGMEPDAESRSVAARQTERRYPSGKARTTLAELLGAERDSSGNVSELYTLQTLDDGNSDFLLIL